MNQTAHISLQLSSISKSVETKVTGCAVTFWRAPPVLSLFLVLRLVAVCLRFRFRVARLAPRWCISAPPVRGVLRLVAGTRKCFFAEMSSFSKKPHFSLKNSVLDNDISRTLGQIGRILLGTGPVSSPTIPICWVIHRPIPKSHQTQRQITRESEASQSSIAAIHPSDSRDSPDR